MTKSSEGSVLNRRFMAGSLRHYSPWMQAPALVEHRFSGAFCLLFSFSTLRRTLADDFRPAVFAGRASVSGCRLQIGWSTASAVHFACPLVFQPLAERSPMIFDPPSLRAGRA